MAERRRKSRVDELDRLVGQLSELRERVALWEERLLPTPEGYPRTSFESARNLVHYIAMRREDLRPTQRALASYGLSSLGRSEAHVMASLDTVLDVIRTISARDGAGELIRERPLVATNSDRILDDRASALFGEPPANRRVRIMVTAPDESAADYSLVRNLLTNGMNCLRINTARGDPADWQRTIENVRRAEKEVGRKCSVLMDLAGPRARTGPIEPGPEVVKVRPERDALGWVTRAADVWLTSDSEPVPAPAPADAVLPLPTSFLASLAPGDQVTFRDARNAKRKLSIVGTATGGRWARLTNTAYVTSGTTVEHRPASGSKRTRHTARIGKVQPLEQRIRLAVGDRLILTRDRAPGRPAIRDGEGNITEPARIPCMPPEVLDDLRVGEPIWLDEGRIGGRITAMDEVGALVGITSAALGGSQLAAFKGINLPETELTLPALSQRDLEILPFVAENADLVGYSFVRTAADLAGLYDRFEALGYRIPGVILKIESARAFEELPAILLEALRHPPVGVMIARGDLAVECGFERLAEVQEEILWLCEAAHLPVIWATQVLEGLAKRGFVSRAEITDAAVGERAECVMLNKGPFIVDGVRVLNDILGRMQTHQEKKRSLMRPLRVADAFLSAAEKGEVPGGLMKAG